MDKVTERLWYLMAILIGFYGNWYFNLMIKLEQTQSQNLPIELIFVISVVTLFVYCIEITHWKRSHIWKFRLSMYLAIVHLISVYILYSVASLSSYWFSGITLWFLIAIKEVDLIDRLKGL